MKKLLLLVAFIGLVAAMPAAAQAGNGTYHGEAEYCSSIYVPCCGGMSIDYCITEKYVVNRNGYHVEGTGTATGPNGETFTIKESYQYVIPGSFENGAWTGNVVSKYTFKSKDSDCSFTVRWTAHMTITPDGTVVVDRYERTLECADGTIF